MAESKAVPEDAEIPVANLEAVQSAQAAVVVDEDDEPETLPAGTGEYVDGVDHG